MSLQLAERLGFAATDRVAIVHCDDIGMCHAANEGAFAALAEGPATCGSVMVPCPWFREAADRAGADTALDLGVGDDAKRRLCGATRRHATRWSAFAVARQSSSR